MFKTYLQERISWITFIVGLQLLSILIALVDPTLSLAGISYLVLLSFIFLVLFIIVRYHRESRFYKKLEEHNDDHYPVSPFQAIVTDYLTTISNQYEQHLSINHMEIEQEKDQLLAWIHEVKTPLTALQLVIDRVNDRSLKQSLHYEWLRLHLLLDQQLHIRRMPAIENDLYIETVDLSSLLTEEIKPLYTWCQQKKIGFDLDLNNSEVMSDGKWLAFIIRQIIINAIKYSNESTIEIKWYEEAQHKKLSIQDYGQGIATQDLPRIFDKGFTSTSTHNNQASTGMGLYLARKVASSLQITIDVNSTLGVGTDFTLTLPNRNAFMELSSM
ncbi:OmpR family two-component system bacitracin resistance sensor histidine kinase BceS [Natronobacillus azotifigens]|uniref:histidine kinase n=1 Tax=Natronobacillus azotifigens TaxID=472978 RepID=A0A9J6RF72_9BACI|nr:sensor histidine kinase [Natronobacillus azotifigens]MCZ0704402.1 sensor histidine kinase [Natronobacillus azotifigens]